VLERSGAVAVAALERLVRGELLRHLEGGDVEVALLEQHLRAHHGVLGVRVEHHGDGEEQAVRHLHLGDHGGVPGKKGG